MAEYIKKETLDELMENRNVRGNCKFCAKYERCIQNGINRKGSHLYCWEKIELPTADVVEVKHSEWVMIPVNGVANYRCGNIDCCRLIPFGQMPSDLPYCPYCGAKMDGERK